MVIIMDKIISYFFGDKEKRIESVSYICDILVSLLSIFLIPNKILTAILIIGLVIIDVLNKYVIDNIEKNKEENFNTEKLININTISIFLAILSILAIIPLVVGLIHDKASFVELFFGNTIPNLLGFATVSSFAWHMSKFNYDDFIEKILRTNYTISFIVKIFYYACFFNSSQFFISKDLPCANVWNNIYLFFVIISGLILGGAFIYRIFIDDKPFDCSPKEVYPTAVLFCGAAYLISCGVPSFFIKVEISPILLTLNTITAFTVAIAILVFVIQKSDKSSAEYPFLKFVVFTVSIFVNCFAYIVHNVENVGDIVYQVATGGGVLIAVISALGIMTIIKSKKRKDNSEKNE